MELELMKYQKYFFLSVEIGWYVLGIILFIT